MMAENPYACPECDGYGEVECDACGSDVECEECDGTGLDPDRLDVPAFTAAAQKLHDETGVSWAWVDKATGKLLGRECAAGRTAYADYARKPAEGSP